MPGGKEPNIRPTRSNLAGHGDHDPETTPALPSSFSSAGDVDHAWTNDDDDAAESGFTLEVCGSPRCVSRLPPARFFADRATPRSRESTREGALEQGPTPRAHTHAVWRVPRPAHL